MRLFFQELQGIYMLFEEVMAFQRRHYSLEFIHELIMEEWWIISDLNDDKSNTTTVRNFWLK